MAFAKTTRPTLASALPRPRLFGRLDRARRRPVTWVWGPPGAGKTTLVASYLTARRQRALWYQVDAGDADVATFFYYLGLAAPRRRLPLPLLTPEYRQGLAIFARRFFRELYTRLAAPWTVVLDNYQEVTAASELHDVMREALDELPRHGRLIFISRWEPPAAFARHLAHESIDVLGGPELRFTPLETRGLVRARGAGRYPEATVRALWERTEGWCAGLILMLDQFRSGDPAAAGPGHPSPEVLFDYFAGEIFKKTDSDVQEVLLQSAFLPVVTPSMAVALTGRPDAGEVLARLHQQNYFTNKKAGAEPTYVYHPLFREFLLVRAARAYAPEQTATLRRQAASLLGNAGQIEAAARLLREAEDWEGLALMVHRHASTLLAQGRAQTVEDWLVDMPVSIIEAQPWLLFWRGIGLLGWRHTDCQRDLQRAFHSFQGHEDALGMFLAWAGIIFAYETEGEAVPFDRWIAVLDEIMQETREFPSKGVETRVAGAMLGAIAMRQPHHPDAARWVERASALVPSHPDPSLRALTLGNWIYFELQCGDLSKVAPMFDEMRALLRARDLSPAFAVNASGPVAWYEALTASPSYRRTVSDMLEISRASGMFYSSRHLALAAGIAGALSDGDLDTVASWLRELERDVHLLGPGFRSWHRWFVVWDALIRNDLVRAASHQPDLLRLASASGRPLDEVVAHLLAALVLHAQGQAREARAQLDRALAIAQAISSPFDEFMARLVEAQLCLDAGREREGLAALRRAMMLGRQRNYVNSFTWIPALMARLCARALAAGIEVQYVRGLVRTRRLVLDDPPMDVEAWPWPIKVYTLGRFEVLREEAPVHFSRKVQRRPLAVLKTLIALGGRMVREDLLMDALWPDTAGDAARLAFNSALHRLRGLLGREGAILRQDGHVSLDARVCWVDVWAVERLLAREDSAAGHEQDVRKAVNLYRGSFLAGEEVDLPQAAALADGLRRRLLRQIARQAGRCEVAEAQRAADWYEEGLRVDPCAEDMSRGLMTAYHRLGRPGAVVDVYARCRAALAARLGRAPSPETDRVLRSLRAD
jgi:ATP/maltotriose-dependent transcriptional regulator MalT/DNA-binding SARP family transcriptional activator